MKVLSLRHCPDGQAGAVRIDRRTKWGNPFVIGRDGDRNQVCDKYEAYLRGNERLLACLPELVGHDLLCWCAPQRCHGDTLIKVMGERGLI